MELANEQVFFTWVSVPSRLSVILFFNIFTYTLKGWQNVVIFWYKVVINTLCHSNHSHKTLINKINAWRTQNVGQNLSLLQFQPISNHFYDNIATNSFQNLKAKSNGGNPLKGRSELRNRSLSEFSKNENTSDLQIRPRSCAY